MLSTFSEPPSPPHIHAVQNDVREAETKGPCLVPQIHASSFLWDPVRSRGKGDVGEAKVGLGAPVARDHMLISVTCQLQGIDSCQPNSQETEAFEAEIYI